MDFQYMTETKKTLHEIATELYQNQFNKGKKHMLNVIGNLNQMAIYLSKEQSDVFVNIVLTPILDAMEGEDSVYLADLITYELIPFIDANGGNE